MLCRYSNTGCSTEKQHRQSRYSNNKIYQKSYYVLFSSKQELLKLVEHVTTHHDTKNTSNSNQQPVDHQTAQTNKELNPHRKKENNSHPSADSFCTAPPSQGLGHTRNPPSSCSNHVSFCYCDSELPLKPNEYLVDPTGIMTQLYSTWPSELLFLAPSLKNCTMAMTLITPQLRNVTFTRKWGEKCRGRRAQPCAIHTWWWCLRPSWSSSLPQLLTSAPA